MLDRRFRLDGPPQNEGRLAGTELRPSLIARLSGPLGFSDALPRNLLGPRRVPGSEQRGGELGEQERPKEGEPLSAGKFGRVFEKIDSLAGSAERDERRSKAHGETADIDGI